MGTRGLKSGAIGLLGAATFGVVMMSPAITIYGSFGPSFISAGRSAPLAFIIAFVATLPTALSYALCSREYPDSGSAAGWVRRVFPERPSIAVGWIAFFYYFLNFIIQPVTLGVFLCELFSMLGWHAGFGIFAGGAILCCAIPASALYRGISLSSKEALGFLLTETTVVIALCATVAWLAPQVNHATFSVQDLSPARAFAGGGGMFEAIIFGIFSFCGYDVISTLADETRAPRRLIPLATLLAVSLFAVLIIGCIWVLTSAADPARLKLVADAGGMPIREIAQMYWGKAALLVPLTAITAALGLVIATGVGSTRVLLSLGQKAHAPAAFARVHPVHQVPWNATHLVMGGGLLLTLLIGYWLGPYQSWVWWGTASTLFALLTFATVNFCNLALFRRQALAGPRGFFLHALIPAAGLGLDGYLLVKCFFIETWKQDFATGKSVILFDVLCLAAAVVFAFRYSNREKRMKKRLLIFGGNGFVGGTVARLARERFETAIAGRTAKSGFETIPFLKVDLTRAEEVRRALDEFMPDAVINAAALSDIDKAENDRALAYGINVEGARNVAQACAERRCRHLYISSDAVFDGLGPQYDETAGPAPVNYYGATKHEGEKAVLAAHPGSVVVRVSLVLGFPVNGGNSFLATFAQSLRSGKEVACAVDEVRTPVDVHTLAESLLELVDGTSSGIVHIGSTEAVDRYELARRAARLLGYGESLLKPKTAASPGRAPRHKNGILNVQKAQRLLKIRMLSLDETLERAIGAHTNENA